MDQSVINIIMGAILSVLGWFARQLWDAVKDLKADVQKIEVDLPKHYVHKDELLVQLNKIEQASETRRLEVERRFDKQDVMLEKIFERIENKVSRADCKGCQ